MIKERFHSMETGDADLDRLRAYLSDWIGWERRYKVDLGVANAVPWAKYMKTYMPSGDNEATGAQTFNVPAMQILDRAVAVLREKEPMLDIALRWRYLNINVQAHVFRFQRLKGLGIEQLDDLADAGERALLPIVKRMGLMFVG